MLVTSMPTRRFECAETVTQVSCSPAITERIAATPVRRRPLLPTSPSGGGLPAPDPVDGGAALVGGGAQREERQPGDDADAQRQHGADDAVDGDIDQTRGEEGGEVGDRAHADCPG